MTAGPRVPPELRPYTVTLTRLRDGATFRYGFTARSCADRFRTRYLAPLPDRAPNPYAVGEVIARAMVAPGY